MASDDTILHVNWLYELTESINTPRPPPNPSMSDYLIYNISCKYHYDLINQQSCIGNG